MAMVAYESLFDPWNVVYLLFILFVSESKAQISQDIRCHCTSLHCKLTNETVCSTSGACFTQWLKTSDGESFMQGCTVPGSPSLLCMNQRPALKEETAWPVLSCCYYSFCNDNLNTRPKPSTMRAISNEISTTTEHVDPRVLDKLNVSSITELKERLRNWTNPHIETFNNIHQLLVIGIGLLLIVIISAIGFYCVLKYKIIYEAKVYNTLALRTQEGSLVLPDENPECEDKNQRTLLIADLDTPV